MSDLSGPRRILDIRFREGATTYINPQAGPTPVRTEGTFREAGDRPPLSWSCARLSVSATISSGFCRAFRSSMR